MRRIKNASMGFVTFMPTGFCKGYQSSRNNLQGVVQASFPLIWAMSKT